MKFLAQVIGLVLALALLAVLVPAEWLLALVFGAGLLFWLWALLDCVLHEPRAGSDRLVWTLIILGAQVFGAALYVGVRRPQRRAERGR